MRIKSLDALSRPEPFQHAIAELPRDIRMTESARAKAFSINQLVKSTHGESFEWYGFTIAPSDAPEIIIDIGLPENDENRIEHTSLSPEKIASFHESLKEDRIINGWIHSHGGLQFQSFSGIDDANSLTVLDYVTSLLRIPLAKREVMVKDLKLLVEGQFRQVELEAGSVSIITDAPVKQARILEAIYGGFCYSVVVDDAGWHSQEIHTKERGVLSGRVTVKKRTASIVLVGRGDAPAQLDMEELRKEVREKIKPVTFQSPKMEKV